MSFVIITDNEEYEYSFSMNEVKELLSRIEIALDFYNKNTVRVDFSMTALDYLRSKARNVNLGHKDSTRNWLYTLKLPNEVQQNQIPLGGAVKEAEQTNK